MSEPTAAASAPVPRENSGPRLPTRKFTDENGVALQTRQKGPRLPPVRTDLGAGVAFLPGDGDGKPGACVDAPQCDADKGFLGGLFGGAESPTKGAASPGAANPDAGNSELAKIGHIRNIPRIDFTTLENVTYLAAGEYAHVYSARMDGTLVAIKRLKDKWQNDKRVRDDMNNERLILSQLHPEEGIVNIMGFGEHENLPFFILEYLPVTLGNYIKSSSSSWPKVFRYAKEIASSLAYLHTKAIENFTVMHRDLKPDNIMVGNDGSIRLVDFGLVCVFKKEGAKGPRKFFSGQTGFVESPKAAGEEDELITDEDRKAAENVTLDLTGRTGSLRYMAPEVSRSQKYNEKAEVYTWALLFWEISVKERPYQGINPKTFDNIVCVKKDRPDLKRAKKWPDELKALVDRCWSSDISARPTFAEVVTELTKIEYEMFGGSVEDIELKMAQACACTVM